MILINVEKNHVQSNGPGGPSTKTCNLPAYNSRVDTTSSQITKYVWVDNIIFE